MQKNWSNVVKFNLYIMEIVMKWIVEKKKNLVETKLNERIDKAMKNEYKLDKILQIDSRSLTKNGFQNHPKCF